MEETERDLAEGIRNDTRGVQEFINDEEESSSANDFSQDMNDALISIGKFYTAEDDTHWYIWVRKYTNEKCVIGAREPDGFTVTWATNGPSDDCVRELGLRGVQVLFQRHPAFSWKVKSTRAIETARDRWEIKKFAPGRDAGYEDGMKAPFRWIGIKIPFKVDDDDDIVISDDETE